MNYFVLDTNILLEYPDVLIQYENIILNSAILEELDGLKKSEGALGYKAREAIRKLNVATNVSYEIKDLYHNMPVDWDPTKRDNKIVMAALHNDAVLVSNDINVVLKAKYLGIKTITPSKVVNNEYQGYKVVKLNDEELSDVYTNGVKNNYDLLLNEYLLIKDSSDEIIDVFVNGKTGMRRLTYPKRVDSTQLGKFVSKDKFQDCVLDSLYNNQMVMIKGKAGTGKSLISLSYAVSQIEKGKYDKIVIFCNPVSTKGAKLGFLPGNQLEKLLDTSIGNMLVSKFGGKIDLVDNWISKERIVLMPFCDIRGFDTTGLKAIVYITEAQNLDIELMRLAIQRIGEDGQLILDGDYNAQVDLEAYEGNKNGMRRVSEIFRDRDFYSEIELNKIYRSKLAEIADLL